MNSLFGLELPTPVNFIIAFIVVLVLIGAVTWAIKRFGAGRMEGGGRGRQPRLAVVDSASVDGRRKLVIVRRDNVEHLLMIGGPSDVVVESSIVRGSAGAVREPTAREPAPAPWAGAEPLPRVMPLPDANPTPWPLAPEPAAPASVAPAPDAPPPVVAPAPRAQAPRKAADETHWADAEPPVPPPAVPHAATPQLSPQPLARPAAREAVPMPPSAPEPAPRPAPQPAAPEDANLAEMAQRLEAALRRPAAGPAPDNVPAAPSRAASAATPPRRTEPRLMPRPPLRPSRPAAPQHPAEPSASAPVHETRLEPKLDTKPDMPQQNQQARTEFENLEQEMASLLGRPSNGKT